MAGNEVADVGIKVDSDDPITANSGEGAAELNKWLESE